MNIAFSVPEFLSRVLVAMLEIRKNQGPGEVWVMCRPRNLNSHRHLYALLWCFFDITEYIFEITDMLLLHISLFKCCLLFVP